MIRFFMMWTYWPLSLFFSLFFWNKWKKIHCRSKETTYFMKLSSVYCEKILVIHIFGGFPQSQVFKWVLDLGTMNRSTQFYTFAVSCKRFNVATWSESWCHRDSMAFAMAMLRLHLLNRYLFQVVKVFHLIM
jgi:hypothetical protein